MDQWATVQREKELNIFRSENLPIIQLHFMHDLLAGNISDAQIIQNKICHLELSIRGPIYTVFLLQYSNSVSDEFKSQYDFDLERWQMLQFFETLGHKGFDICWCELEPQKTLIILNLENGEAAKTAVQNLAISLRDSLQKSTTIPFLIAVGSSVDNLECIRTSYNQANSLLEHWISCEDFSILYYEKLKGQLHTHPTSDTINLENRVLTLLESKDGSGAILEFNLLCSHYKEHCLPVYLLKAIAKKIIAVLSQDSDPAQNQHYKESLQVIDQISNPAAMQSWLTGQMKSKIIENKPFQYSSGVEKTISYIDQHYSENLTLQSLSKQVFLSPNYLGKKFREETGYKITDWINKIRLEKSMELLKNTALKTYQIAEKVGFSSYKYFSILFLKHNGCSAREYRKSLEDSAAPTLSKG